MIAHELTLQYSLHPGWLAPYVEALMQGRALAHECRACGDVSFPPLRVCTCGNDNQRWTALSGRAEVKFQTSGADGAFGLVRFDGATTLAIARLDGFSAKDTAGALYAPNSERPIIALRPFENGSQS